ncbi:MAG TPA: hypothetical protein ENJ18_12805 [Nannocystis exedens]|nr:hypothetical protein [Nannocystis exedens]
MATLTGPLRAQAAEDGDSPATDVIYPELAADVPEAEWIREGGGSGDAAPTVDPHILNHRIRRAGKLTLVGGALAVLGAATALGGASLIFIWSPENRLTKLAEKNGGLLPTNDATRHRIIQGIDPGPIVAYTGLGILAGGVITATVFRIRLKKLRDKRKASASLSPTFLRGGAAIQWKVSF